MVSTLIETININAEDFTENFLTCPTCMSHYDNCEHNPKLLPCSHTLCKSCLERIASTAIQYTTSTLSHHQTNTGTLSSSIAAAAADAAASIHSPTLLASLASTSTIGSSSSLSSTSTLATQNSDLCFRCPICRETIVIPRGGISSLPPSFIVNQLLDLVNRQRRDLVPRCTNHTQEELLFCETCDTIFCSICESHCRLAQNSDHIVIPFSIAIKRMSEIICFKSNQCVNSFNLALVNVNREIEKLNQSVELCSEHVNTSFNELNAIIEKKREETLHQLCKIRDSKLKSLREQMQLISNEKLKVENECKENMSNNKIDVRFLTQQIQNLNEKLDCLRTLCEPRENFFINYEYKNFNKTNEQIKTVLQTHGKFKVSSTYPSLCTAKFETASINLKTSIYVQTVDYCGKRRLDGGDPLTVCIYDSQNRQLSQQQIEIVDESNGMYLIQFTPSCAGVYRIDINIFDRSINKSPFQLDVSEHINSIWCFSGKGRENNGFNMPVSVRVLDDFVYVLDSGNNRIKVLDKNGAFQRHIENSGLGEASCTSICMNRVNKSILAINWRLKLLTEFCISANDDQASIHNFEIKDSRLQEPITIMEAFNLNEYLILDSKKLHLCDSATNIIQENIDEKMRTYCGIKNITCYCCSTDVTKQKRVFIADSTATIYEFDFDWLLDKASTNRTSSSGLNFRKFNANNGQLSTSTVSIASNNSLNSNGTSASSSSTFQLQQQQQTGTLGYNSSLYGNGNGNGANSKGSYTALYFDEYTNKLLAAKCDKQKTVIEVYNSETHSYEYSIDSYNDKLKRITSLCTTSDGFIVCTDLVQSCVKMFRFI